VLVVGAHFVSTVEGIDGSLSDWSVSVKFILAALTVHLFSSFLHCGLG
jgi:hypothetical protein